jgi:acyl carrier protein
VDLIRSQFREEDRSLINETTDLKALKEWSSLQTMIIVSEIDKEYGVILDFENIRDAHTVSELFAIVQCKID